MVGNKLRNRDEGLKPMSVIIFLTPALMPGLLDFG
jgi:hypothetical protein